MQSIQHQSEKHLFFFATIFSFYLEFFCFVFIAKRTMVLYNLNMVHLICKAYSKYNRNPRKTKVWYMLSLLMVLRYIWVFSLISSCVLYLLSSYLFWTELEVDHRHWSTLFIMTIHTHAHKHTHALFRTESLQNKISSFFPSLLMNCDGLIYSIWWPKVIDQHSWVLARLTDFVLVVVFSVTEMPLYFQLLSALFFTQPFCLEKNKKYYIHIWIWCFCSLFAYS